MRKLACLCTLLLFGIIATAQTRTITGTVLDATGSPIPFATVTEAGTKNGVSADVNGNFTIKVGDNAKLSISASGFTSQTITPSGARASITLARGEGNLQEVVVTALGQCYLQDS